MPIYPLPQFEADLKAQEEADRKAYDALKAPKTMVVRFGAMKLVGEFPYDGSAKPGCGSKIVVRTHRGTEIGEMLTSTCPNSGCSKSVSRKEMLGYIENSGGRDYPFFTEGRVLRVATMEDMDKQAKLEQTRHELKMNARMHAERIGLQAKIVDAEPLLGGERILFYYMAEDRIDLRALIDALGAEHKTRIEMKPVGARDEARLTADYEKCGQHCCCKNFLKVLKPVSMKSAKDQKATLDPLKISGRCGRLMCCLRYEDQTYDELKKRLPRRKSRVGTPEGDGTVLDGQILTQLVLVRLDLPDETGKIKEVAVPVENLTPPVNATAPALPPMPTPMDRRGPRPAGPGGPGGQRGPGGPGAPGGPQRGTRPPQQGQSPQAGGPGQPQQDRGQRGPRPDRSPDRGPGGPNDRNQADRNQADRNQAGGQGGGRPPQPRDARPPQQRPPQNPPPQNQQDIPDFDDIETDAGDDFGPDMQGPHDGGPQSGPGGQGGGQGGGPGGPGGGGRRRRRRRRGRGGGPGGGPGGNPSGGQGGNGGGPSSPPA
ncbi:MAG: regulatory iron-sulfur-containing complex subunit RicT [Planctomycetota bacterium]|nr:regulatory iron-sulfur-containing complex subunit RicT [Planctomycetota bacterium]